jgi:LPXTG-motif cell wall-anchored protein
MNILKLLITGAVITAGIAITTTPVNAAKNCEVNRAVNAASMHDITNNSIVQNGNKVDVKVTVKGDADCKKTVSVATWKWYNETGLPLEEQRLFKTATQTFGIGTHTISVEVPDCRWQADLVEGTRATAADGTANYKIGAPNDETDRLMDFAFGQLAVCTDSVAQPTTPTTATTATNAATITRLPNTGTGNMLLNALTISSATGFAYSLVRNRKQSK